MCTCTCTGGLPHTEELPVSRDTALSLDLCQALNSTPTQPPELTLLWLHHLAGFGPSRREQTCHNQQVVSTVPASGHSPCLQKPQSYQGQPVVPAVASTYRKGQSSLLHSPVGPGGGEGVKAGTTLTQVKQQKHGRNRCPGACSLGQTLVAFLPADRRWHQEIA